MGNTDKGSVKKMWIVSILSFPMLVLIIILLMDDIIGRNKMTDVSCIVVENDFMNKDALWEEIRANFSYDDSIYSIRIPDNLFEYDPATKKELVELDLKPNDTIVLKAEIVDNPNFDSYTIEGKDAETHLNLYTSGQLKRELYTTLIIIVPGIIIFLLNPFFLIRHYIRRKNDDLNSE